MKDEAAGKIMCEVVGLRAKMYSFKVFDPVTGRFKITKKAKGIQKCAMETVTHEQYLAQLHNPEENHVTVRRIGQVMHTVMTFEQQKRGLCAFDDKRYLLDDGVDTLAHGHFRIRDEQTVPGENAESQPLQRYANVVTDEDGDQHLIVTQQAVARSPVLQQLFQDDEQDLDDQPQPQPPMTLPTNRLPNPTIVRLKRTHEQSSATSKPANPSTPKPPKQPKVLEPVQVLVNEAELTAAKAALRTRFNEMDVEIAQELIQTALVGLDGPMSTVESLKAALQRRGGMEALCSLAILEDAHKANKTTGLSGDEQLLFVTIKATKVFHTPYTKNPHKSLFMLLTGRSASWWDKHHMRMLSNITNQPR
jgi:hypothetical protein